MKKNIAKGKKPKPASPTREEMTQPRAPEVALKRKNYILLGAGVATIVAGFITLASGSITIAPLLLVVGYCVLIPLALLLK